MHEVLELFAEGLQQYRQRQWRRALACFGNALKRPPHDGPSRLYVDRYSSYVETPPDESWDGVLTLHEK